MPIKPRLEESSRRTDSIMQDRFKKLLFNLASVTLWVAVWQLLAIISNRRLLFKIPTPTETATEFLSSAKDLKFWSAVENSLLHILSGFAAAVVLGLICGMLSGNSKLFKTLTAPVTRLIRSVPVAAFIILAWLWIPSGAIPAYISFLMVFPIIWLQVEAGLLSVDNRLVEMASVMGMNKKGIIKNIKIPAVLPYFRESVITGLGFAWKSGVAAEVICNPTGSIGALLSNAKSNLEYKRVFALVFTIVILSLILENIIKFFWRRAAYDRI